MTLVAVTPPGYEPERRYILDVVFGEFLGIEVAHETAERRDVLLRGEGAELTLPDVLFATPEGDWLTERSLLAEPLAESRDLLGSAFFLLTRYEEKVSAARDAHDRFPASASILSRERVLDRPLVNEYVARLWELMRERWPRLERRRRSFRLLPSHDVDMPTCGGRSLRHAAGDVLKRRDPALALRRLAGADVCNTFAFLLDESERAGVRSAFYFLAGHTGPGGIDGNYTLDDPTVRSLIGRIRERGHELGVHGSYETFRDADALAREADALREFVDEPFGGRQHYLRWENPATWRAYEAAGLVYDTTLGFADAPGFRCGVCWEFPVFDLERRRRLALRERPLVAMEASLLQYQSLSFDAMLERLLALKETCRRYDGDFTLLWHNDRLIDRRARHVYREVLRA